MVKVVAGVVGAVLVLIGGYAAADAQDVVPGPLTTKPVPAPAPTLPTAPGVRFDTSTRTDVLGQLDPNAPRPTKQGLATSFGAAAADPRLGPSTSAVVTDGLTGEQLFSLSPDVPKTPASVLKVLTGAAALNKLGPQWQATTKVVADPKGITLVAAGDVFMSDRQADPQSPAGRADINDLATATADALKKQGRTSVTLTLDDTIFGAGPQLGAGWEDSVAAGYVAPMTSIAIDAGRVKHGNYVPREADPAMATVKRLAVRLNERGITVAGAPARAKAPAGATGLAEVKSAPLIDLIDATMLASDNNGAEMISRWVAVARGMPATFAGGGQAVLAELAGLGLNISGAVAADGSGLSDGSVVPASLLAGTLTKAVQDDDMRPLLGGLPVANATGTLHDRFGAQPRSAGVVRAKTGTLLKVSSLAGIVVTKEGRLLVFVLMADQTNGFVIRPAMDAATNLLTDCGCR